MKIAQFIGKLGPGGAEVIALKLARAIENYAVGMDSVIFTTEITDHAWMESHLKNSDVEVVVLPKNLMELWGTKSILKFSREFSYFLLNEDISLLHSHMFPQIIRGAMSAKLAGIPHIGTLHDVYSIIEKESRIRLLKAASKLGTHLVAVSQDMQDTYLRISRKWRFCKMDTNDIQLIYNGVDTEMFYPRDCDRPCCFNMVSVGRLDEVKNYDLLLRAMDNIVNLKGHTDINLSLIGDGPERQTLEAFAYTYLPDNVEFLGSRGDVPELLCGYDMFVLPSRSEGLSCSILEAMASGLPILATNVGGNNELVTRNGILIPPNDVSALVDTIIDIAALKLKGDEILDGWGTWSLRTIEKDFSIGTMVNKYHHLYTKYTS